MVTRDPHAASRVDFAHFFDYLVLARGRLLDWIGAQRADLYTQAYPAGLGSITAA